MDANEGMRRPSATILEASATQVEMNWHGLQVMLASARKWCASSSQCSGVAAVCSLSSAARDTSALAMLPLMRGSHRQIAAYYRYHGDVV